MMNFNPHSHEGSDRTGCISKLLRAISIHTPTKGVTVFSQLLFLLLDNFNPHSHEGSDPYSSSISDVSNDFNPHSHEGSDTAVLHKQLPHMDFNPHSHEGSDVSSCVRVNDTSISIHTPTKGVTRIINIHTTSCGFQSTLPRRE